jgi:hydrogenase maturation protease
MLPRFLFFEDVSPTLWDARKVISMSDKRILVLGVGNILLHDEGVGVRTIEKLDSEYDFSPNVELMDGGTLGIRLLDPISQADRVIVVDAVQNGQTPGTIYRLSAEELDKRLNFKNSLHQLNLVETLAYAEMLGNRPSAVIIGIEPADMSPWGVELTETIQSRFLDLCKKVLEEVELAGGTFKSKKAV